MLRKLAYSDLAMKPVSEHKAETQKLFGTAAPRLISTMSDVSGTCAVTLPPQCPLRHQLHPNRPADPRGSEAARPKINLLKSSRTRGPGGALLRPMPGVPAARARCRAVRGSRSWHGIVPLRTSHGTAGIACRARRRGSRVAARGARQQQAMSWAHSGVSPTSEF